MTDSKSLIEFLTENRINWFPINLELKTNKKNVIKKKLKPYNENGEMPSYNDMCNIEVVEKRQKLVDNYEYIWVDTRFTNQIDVDGEIDPNIDTPYTLSVSKQKRHYFVKGFYGLMRKRIDTKWDKVELLCGQGSYARKDGLVYNFEKNIKDYCGTVDEVLVKDGKPATNSRPSLNDTICSSLNEIFITLGKWRSNCYSSAKSIILIPNDDKTCIVTQDKKHSCVKCFVVLSKTSCYVRCHKCGDRKIDVKKNNSSWKLIRNYFDMGTEDNVTYDVIQDYLDDHCIGHGLMKKDGYIMEPCKIGEIDSSVGIEFVKKARYGDFLDKLFREADSPYKKAYKKPTAKKNLIEYLSNIHTDILILKRDPNIICFNNGFLKLKEWTFHRFDKWQEGLVAKKYIPFEFEIDWLNMEWTDPELNCEVFDKIINDQPQISGCDDVKLAFYGLLGSLHYPVGGDPLKVAPYLVGTSGTGKSTIVNIIMNTFSSECIGAINYKEGTFGKSAFLDHEVIMDSDAPANMIVSFGKTDFQKAVSGETIAIPIKNQKQEEQHKVTQRMFFCSQYMQDVQDTGEVIRRIAYFGFEPVENTRSDLEEYCIENELHKILMKILLARRALIKRYRKTPFHEWNISYFDSRRDDILMENNYIYRFISENKNFRIRKKRRYPFQDFVQLFYDYYKGQPKRPKKPKTTDVMFTKMGLAVVKDIECKDCGRPFSLHCKCCEGYSPNNKTMTYYISGLDYEDLSDKPTICDINDDNNDLV